MRIDQEQLSFTGTLIAFVGDTPAVNMVGGFKEGVNMAMRLCRHCMATKNQIQSKVSITNMSNWGLQNSMVFPARND